MFTYGMGRYTTGIGKYASELSYALKRRDPTIDLWLLNPYGVDRMRWFQDFPNRRLAGVSTLPGVLARGHAVLSAAARDLHLDIVHDPCGIAPFFGRRGRRGSAARVVTIHDAIPLVHPELQPALTRLVFSSFIQWSPRTVDAVLTTSQSAATDLVRHVPGLAGRLTVAYPGTRIPSLEELHRRREAASLAKGRGDLPRRYLLYVGNQDPRKNVATLLRAFAVVRRAAPDVDLLLVGPDTWGRRSAIAHGLPEGARWLGYLPDAHLHRAYAGAEAVVLPSLYEGFGQPVLEGMAHGVPVVASNRSSIPEVAADAALLVDPEDESALARAMGRVLREPDLAQSLGRRGRARSEQFTWDHTATGVLAVYRAARART
jgi:glycosyltransferase involved in cell wall biosynthesis